MSTSAGVADVEAGSAISPLSDNERFNVVRGVTCHAMYHAGQIQLIKRLRGEQKVASIRKELVVEAPADHVWAAIRDVGAVHTRLARDFVVDTRLEGDSRVVTFANGEVVRERIVDIDDRARRLAYAVVEWRTTHHNASFQVVPDSERRCRVVWITDLLPDTLAALVEGLMEQGGAAIKRTLETADVTGSDTRRHFA